MRCIDLGRGRASPADPFRVLEGMALQMDHSQGTLPLTTSSHSAVNMFLVHSQTSYASY